MQLRLHTLRPLHDYQYGLSLSIYFDRHTHIRIEELIHLIGMHFSFVQGLMGNPTAHRPGSKEELEAVHPPLVSMTYPDGRPAVSVFPRHGGKVAKLLKELFKARNRI